jgi:hypothetical protein
MSEGNKHIKDILNKYLKAGNMDMSMSLNGLGKIIDFWQ